MKTLPYILLTISLYIILGNKKSPEFQDFSSGDNRI